MQKFFLGNFKSVFAGGKSKFGLVLSQNHMEYGPVVAYTRPGPVLSVTLSDPDMIRAVFDMV